MKKILFLLLLFAFQMEAQVDEINPIVSNNSWISAFGSEPNSNDPEGERIKTHLNYVLTILKESPPSSPSLKDQRDQNLSLLKDYIKAANFPRDIEYHKNRRPCFIDNSGNICAVGYLVEQTSSRSEAQRINGLFQYEFLRDMEDEKLLEWQQSSGLSFKELEMIQPTYRLPIYRRSIFYDEKKKKFGTKDATGKKILLKAKYDEIKVGIYPNTMNKVLGTEIVKLNGKWALLKSNGDPITDFKYDSIRGSSSFMGTYNDILFDGDRNPGNEFLFAYKNGNLEVFEGNGNIRFKRNNTQILDSEGEIFIAKQNELLGLISGIGKELIPLKYDDLKIIKKTAGPCFIGRVTRGPNNETIEAFQVKKGKLFGLFNSNYKITIPIEYEFIRQVGKELWLLKEDSKLFLCNSQGEKILKQPVQNVEPLGDCRKQNLKIQANSKFGLLDSAENWLLKPEYDYIEGSYTYYEFRKGGLSGYLNSDGSQFLPLEYAYIHRRSDGTFFVSKNNLTGRLTAEGKVLIPVKYHKLTKFYEDEFNPNQFCYYGAEEWGKWKIMTDRGEYIGNQIFDSVLHLGRKCFRVKLDGYWFFGKYSKGGLVFQKNLKVEDLVWVNIGIYAYRQNGKYGLWTIYNLDQEEGPMFQPKFDSILPVKIAGEERFLIKQNGKYGIAKSNGEISIAPEYEEYQELKYSYSPNNSLGFKKGELWYFYSVSSDSIAAATARQIKVILQKKAEKKKG